MTRILLVSVLFCLTISVKGQNKVTPETLWKLARVSEPKVSPDGKSVIYNVRKFDVAENKGQSDIYSVAVTGGTPRVLADSKSDETHARWRPDGKRIGFLTADKNGKNQLWEMNADGSDKKQITSVDEGINQFGYAATLNRIWYTSDVKLDKKPSEIYPDLPKTENARIIDGLMFRHWNAWHDYAYSHLFIAEYNNGTVSGAKDIMPGERWDVPLMPFGGDEQISFSPDGKILAYTCKKFNGTGAAVSTDSDIYLFDTQKNTTVNITEGNDGYDNDPMFSPDSKKMLWLSMKTPGYESDRNRLFIYDITTGDKKELFTGYDNNVDHAYWSADGKSVFFMSAINATRQIFVWDGKAYKQLTTDQADYNELSVQGSGSKAVLIASRVDMTNPSDLYSINPQTGKATRITDTNKDTWNNLPKAKIEKRMVKASDGKDILTWVIFPPDFDPAKKYPTLLLCQGGPQSVVSQTFSYRWNFSLMAAQGYIIVAPNRRGLPSFGSAWNEQISGDWGGQAMRDLLSAIDDVSKEPYVNKEKLGAIGASFGGYSVYWLAGNHNKRFKAFISHCGVFNLESEYGTTEEIFFANHDLKGAYWEKPQPISYEKFSPHRFVKNWDTPMLVIHNEKDFRVPINQGIEAFTAAQLNNVPSRFLYFPDEGHWVTKPQNSILWNRVFFEWLDTYLK